MNEDQLNDLKQFIVATVAQATAEMATKDDITRLEVKLEGRLDDLEFKVDTITETLNDRLEDHDVRLTRLEQQIA